MVLSLQLFSNFFRGSSLPLIGVFQIEPMNPSLHKITFTSLSSFFNRPLSKQQTRAACSLRHFQYYILLSMFQFPFLSCNSQKFHIEPQYDAVMPFLNGIAAVKQQNLWGFIDPSGKWIFSPKFASVQMITDAGYAVEDPGVETLQIAIHTSNDQWILAPYTPESAKFPTSSGMRFLVQFDDGYAIADNNSKKLTDAVYDTITYIGSDLFIGYRNYKSELLNSNGKIISDQYTEILPPILFDRIKCIDDHHYGLLSVEGKEIIAPDMTILEIAGQNVACTKGGNLKLYTDQLELLSDFEFDRVLHFENGNWIARNTDSGESKLFSPFGKLVSDKLSFGYGDIMFGLMPAGNQNGLWGYVNCDGKEVIPFQFKYAESFMPNGKAVIWKEGQGRTNYFLVDTSGREISSPPFDKIEWHPDGVYSLEYDNRNQLLDEDFNPITKLSGNPVQYIGDGVYIKFKASRSTKLQKPNFYTGEKFKIYRSWDVEPVSFHSVDGSLLLKAEDFDESDPKPSVSEGLAMAKKRGKWGFIKTSRPKN